MGHVLKSELVITGSDKTGGMWAGVIRHAEEAKAALAGLSNMRVGDAGARQANRELRERIRMLGTERRAVQEIGAANRAANEALAARTGLVARMQARFPGLAHASGMGWMVGGLASGRLAHAAGHDAAEFSHQRAMLTVAGMQPSEVREAVDKAFGMRIAGMSVADNLRAIGELRMVFGSTEHALQHVEAVQRSAAALKAINPNMDAEGEAYNLARALELKGISNDPAHFLRLQNMMVQAINASRGKVTAGDYLAFTNRAGTGTTSTLSDFFYSRIAPTLIQEMTGATAGRALATLRRQLLGGHMQLQSAGEWLDLGLLDRHKVEFNKIGNVKRVRPGALVDSDLFSVDPYAWIQGYLVPALEKKFKNKGGLTDERLAAEMATLFSDRYAENMATILLKQKQRLEKDARLAAGGAGNEAADYARSHDALAAARDLGSATNSLLAAFASPLADPAITAMNGVADWARYISQMFGHYSEKHPYRAMATTGALGAGLTYVGVRGLQSTFGFFGIGRSAVALTGSAAALDASAAALDGAAVKLGLSPAGPVSSIAKGGLGAWLLRAAGIAAGTTLGAAGFYFGSTEEANAGERDIYKRNADGTLTLTSYGRTMQADLNGGVPLPPSRPDIEHAQPPAKAEISGDASVKVDVHVRPEAGFWATVKSMVSNGIDHIRIHGQATGSTGSLGTSMPESGISAP